MTDNCLHFTFALIMAGNFRTVILEHSKIVPFHCTLHNGAKLGDLILLSVAYKKQAILKPLSHVKLKNPLNTLFYFNTESRLQ